MKTWLTCSLTLAPASTQLHDAALQGQVGAAHVLLDAGADVNIKNNAGKTPLDLARQHGHEYVAAVLQTVP
ncbi:MAG TPA: hypothetical protein DD643_01815 [Synechococcus sp. UBA8638]|nr:hypothetical protein [Synechococcus sp. UBA8638]